jgi:predicted phage terminase large subunit-like protein
MAQLLGYEVAPVHERMAQSEDEDRSLTLAPRGFGKSTVLSVVRCIFETVRNPDVRILLASNTQPQAEAFLREIRGHFERNQGFLGVFGDFVGPKWSDSQIVVRQRNRIAKEPTIFAIGVGGGLISKHFDVIICDDIVDEENSRTEPQRERLRVWFFKVLLPCLEPHGKLCVIGTRYHYRDLYGHFIESGFAPATIIRALGPDGSSAWPEKFPAEKLEKIRRQAGTVIFNAQYQNDTEAMKGAVFKADWLQYCDSMDNSGTPCPKVSPDYPQHPDPRLAVFQGVDLSIGRDERSDYFAMVTIGVNTWDNIYVLDCYMARLSFKQQTAAILERYKRFDPIKLAIEANAYQAVQVERVRELGAVRATKVYTTCDKLSRAWKLSALFEDGRVRLNRNMSELVEQLLVFPQGEHDDLIDALDLAIGVSSSPCPRIRFL